MDNALQNKGTSRDKLFSYHIYQGMLDIDTSATEKNHTKSQLHLSQQLVQLSIYCSYVAGAEVLRSGDVLEETVAGCVYNLIEITPLHTA